MYVQYTPHTHSNNSESEDRKTQFGIQTIKQKNVNNFTQSPILRTPLRLWQEQHCTSFSFILEKWVRLTAGSLDCTGVLVPPIACLGLTRHCCSACLYIFCHPHLLTAPYFLFDTDKHRDREIEVLDRVYSRLIAVLTKALRYSFFPYSASASNTCNNNVVQGEILHRLTLQIFNWQEMSWPSHWSTFLCLSKPKKRILQSTL
jgi:hypothetical protein